MEMSKGEVIIGRGMGDGGRRDRGGTRIEISIDGGINRKLAFKKYIDL